MNTVKELLLKECDYPLSGEVMDRFLESAEELHLKRNEILIMSGKVDANIYVVKEGIMRYSYMNGLREVTYAFSLPGTMIISMFSYYFHLPTFYQIEACCESTVVRITRAAVRHADSAVARLRPVGAADGSRTAFLLRNEKQRHQRRCQGALSLAGEKPPRNHGKGAAEIRGFLSGNHAVVPEPAEKAVMKP